MQWNLADEYLQGVGKIRAAVAGLTPAQLNAVPVAGTWSIQQIVLHLMDDELIWTDRVKRMIAEENPTLMDFNESLYASELHYELWSIEDAITVFELTRRNFVKVIAALPENVINRTGSHSARGEFCVGDVLPMMVRHVDHHLKFALEKRKMVEGR